MWGWESNQTECCSTERATRNETRKSVDVYQMHAWYKRECKLRLADVKQRKIRL